MKRSICSTSQSTGGGGGERRGWGLLNNTNNQIKCRQTKENNLQMQSKHLTNNKVLHSCRWPQGEGRGWEYSVGQIK